MRRKIRLDREHEECDQQAGSNPGMHVTRQAQPAHKGKRSETVYHVIDVETVARPQAMPNACESAIKRVPEPIECQAGNRAEQRIPIPRCQRITGPGADLCRESEDCQVVRPNPCRRSGREPK